jgi:hypothetical protein
VLRLTVRCAVEVSQTLSRRVIRAGNLVAFARSTGPVDYDRVTQVINQVVYLITGAAISLVQLVKDVRRLVANSSDRVSVGQVQQKS